MAHKILHKTIDLNIINLMLTDGSACELSNQASLKSEMEKTYKIKVQGELFWFHRLKATQEGQGAGSFLMRELIDVLDQNKYSVMSVLNPYGSLSMESLIKFYKKFDFVLVGEGIMFREPKIIRL